MKTFQIRISKEDKHRCLKFKSELPMESVLGAVKAVVKNTYHVSIKEIHWRVPEDRDIMWAINKAASIRFYHKVWKETVTEVEEEQYIGNLIMPRGTIVGYNVTSNTFFNIIVPKPWCIKLDLDKVRKLSNLDIYYTHDAPHTFYLKGKYKITYEDVRTDFTLISFFKINTKLVVSGEFITEEL